MKENYKAASDTSRQEHREIANTRDDRNLNAGEKIPDPDDAIGRYTYMKAYEWNVSVTEAASRSMARLYGQVKQSDGAIVILTAFRGERKLAENRALNRQLAADVRLLGWGYTPVLGGFVEKSEGGQENRIQEESFFCNTKGSSQQVMAATVKFLQKYQQEAALVKLPDKNDAMLLFPNGSTHSVGQWQADPNQMAQFYTRMRSGPQTKQFKFEAAGDDSVMTRYAIQIFFNKKR